MNEITSNPFDINRQETWLENMPSPVSETEMEKWQQRINAIVGTEPDGTLRLRLVWGGDFSKTWVWHRYRQEWMPRYWTARIKRNQLNPATGLIESKVDYIGIPRFFLESLVYQTKASVKAEMAGKDADGDIFTEAKIEGPRYTTVFPICNHQPTDPKTNWKPCCLKAEAGNPSRKCFGMFRGFDDFDLNFIAEDFQAASASWLPPPSVEMTNADRVRLAREQKAVIDAHQQKADAELDLLSDETMATLHKIYRQSQDPSAKKGRWSLPSIG